MEKFHYGFCTDAYHFFGAHFVFEGESGVRFTVYAPHARRVFVCGSFTDWDRGALPMERTEDPGIWSLFVGGIGNWVSYKYRIEDGHGRFFDKSDPYAFYSETRPANASKTFNLSQLRWHDADWMEKRTVGYDAPVSIYEVYAGGWRRNGEYPYTYSMLADSLIPYVKEHGFTHIEMMPLTEHPFDGSWGYQVSGYYAVTSRYGNPLEFAAFVDRCHAEGIGVILDFVPVHFVKDAFGLARFDGEPLYEYPDDRDAENEWGTLNFDLWKEEVRSFLISAACFWCDVYHVDGIRTDAVSNIIYWGGEKRRGTNTGALDFIKRMNYAVHDAFPGVMLFAEDSTDYPGVTESTLDGGLGFDYKWDLGWMNDTLTYCSEDPHYRKHDHHLITFSMSYFAKERFILAFSHDENVHGKKTIAAKMFGSYEMKFAEARGLYAYMFAHPGKKLNFMGSEFAMLREFDEKRELDWDLLKYPVHDSFLRFFTDLNRTYVSHPALYAWDYDPRGFAWINADNAMQSVYSFCRTDGREDILCILNCTQQYYETYNIEVPGPGFYNELINSEKDIYSGCGLVNDQPLEAWRNGGENPGFPYSITIKLAPLAAIWFCRQETR